MVIMHDSCSFKFQIHVLESGVLYEAETAYHSRAPICSPPGFGRVHVAHLFSFLCYVIYFVCLCPVHVSCVSNVTSVSRLSILDHDCLSVFSNDVL